MCKSKNTSQSQKLNHFVDDVDTLNDNEVDYTDNTASIHSIEKAMETFVINGHRIQMQIDTGASVSILSSSLWELIGKPKLSKSVKKLESYDGHVMEVLGEVNLPV